MLCGQSAGRSEMAAPRHATQPAQCARQWANKSLSGQMKQVAVQEALAGALKEHQKDKHFGGHTLTVQ